MKGQGSGETPKTGNKVKARRTAAKEELSAPVVTPDAVDASDLGRAIRKARTAAGLSQIAMAALLETSQANVVRLEKGRSQPTTRTLQRIADVTAHELAIAFVPRAATKRAGRKDKA